MSNATHPNGAEKPFAAPTRERDVLGREWTVVEYGLLRQAAPGAPRETFTRGTVERLCGPLVPVEPMARVRVGEDTYSYVAYACKDVFFPGAICFCYPDKNKTAWPFARAEEIAAAFRVLGYLEACVEIITDA